MAADLNEAAAQSVTNQIRSAGDTPSPEASFPPFLHS
jgi:hypothetical protein